MLYIIFTIVGVSILGTLICGGYSLNESTRDKPTVIVAVISLVLLVMSVVTVSVSCSILYNVDKSFDVKYIEVYNCSMESDALNKIILNTNAKFDENSTEEVALTGLINSYAIKDSELENYSTYLEITVTYYKPTDFRKVMTFTDDTCTVSYIAEIINR